MAESGLVYVVDDDISLCELIEATLKSAGLDVRSFPTADAFADAIASGVRRGCCVLLDLVLPGTSGLAFLERHATGISCPVIVISARGTIEMAVKSMKLGAVDFLEKPFSMETLRDLVVKTIERYRERCERDQTLLETRHRLASLSPRERELLQAIVRGESTKMAADRLKISARTVDHHRANLMQKMRATNVADLVRMAILADYENVEIRGARSGLRGAVPI